MKISADDIIKDGEPNFDQAEHFAHAIVCIIDETRRPLEVLAWMHSVLSIVISTCPSDDLRARLQAMYLASAMDCIQSGGELCGDSKNDSGGVH